MAPSTSAVSRACPTFPATGSADRDRSGFLGVRLHLVSCLRRLNGRFLLRLRAGLAQLTIVIVGTLRAVTKVAAHVSPAIRRTAMPAVTARAVSVGGGSQ